MHWASSHRAACSLNDDKNGGGAVVVVVGVCGSGRPSNQRLRVHPRVHRPWSNSPADGVRGCMRIKAFPTNQKDLVGVRNAHQTGVGGRRRRRLEGTLLERERMME